MKVVYKIPIDKQILDAVRLAEATDDVIDYIQLTKQEWYQLQHHPRLRFKHNELDYTTIYGVQLR